MMKRTALAALALLCAAGMTLSLTGCFGKEEAGDTTATTTTAAPTTTAPQTTGTTAQTYPFTGYVNASTLNVRPTADTSGYAIGGLVFGDTVQVIDREGDWYKINFGSGFGYVSAQYVQDTVPVSTTAGTDTTITLGDTTVAESGATTTDAVTTTAPDVVAP